MVGANVVVAEDDAAARRLFTSAQQSFANILRGRRGQLPPPVDDIESYWSPPEKERASAMLRRSFVGSRGTVREGLEAFVAETAADELIVAAAIHNHAARLRSYELLGQLAAVVACGESRAWTLAADTRRLRQWRVRREAQREASGA